MWSESRLLQEIEYLLDEGWTFSFSKGEDLIWDLKIFDGTESLVHTSSGGFPNVVLLSGYTWLSLRLSPAPTGNWVPRTEELSVRLGSGQEIQPDPADLDPDEVLKVVGPG